ncbi:hypothetical protein Q7P36_006133 [Cladosporium allicinum]
MEITAPLTNIETVALVVDKPGGAFELKPVVFDEVRDDEYLVEMLYSGICHTDLLLRDGLFGDACKYPAIFGHEGAGIVRKAGKAVRDKSIREGDAVLLSFTNCATCPSCRAGRPARCWNFIDVNFKATRYSDGKPAARSLDGQPIGSHFFGHSSFAKLSVVQEACVTRYPYDDIENLGLYAGGGCGFQTGAGAVLNTLKPAPSESLLIFGLGSVGLTALMAAKHLGLETMIAVDIEDSKLELAKDLGATHVLNAKSQDILSEVLKITGRGASFAIDCTGVPSMIELLVECIHPFGTASSIGDAPAGVKIKIDPLSFVVTGKTFVGLVEGDSIPQKVDCHRLLCQQDPYTDLDTQFLPELIDLHKCGKFPVDRLVSIHSVKDLDRALEDMESGVNIKTVIKWDI